MKQYITGQIAYKSDSQSEPYGCIGTLFDLPAYATLKKGKNDPAPKNRVVFLTVLTSIGSAICPFFPFLDSLV